MCDRYYWDSTVDSRGFSGCHKYTGKDGATCRNPRLKFKGAHCRDHAMTVSDAYVTAENARFQAAAALQSAARKSSARKKQSIVSEKRKEREAREQARAERPQDIQGLIANQVKRLQAAATLQSFARRKKGQRIVSEKREEREAREQARAERYYSLPQDIQGLIANQVKRSLLQNAKFQLYESIKRDAIYTFFLLDHVRREKYPALNARVIFSKHNIGVQQRGKITFFDEEEDPDEEEAEYTEEARPPAQILGKFIEYWPQCNIAYGMTTRDYREFNMEASAGVLVRMTNSTYCVINHMGEEYFHIVDNIKYATSAITILHASFDDNGTTFALSNDWIYDFATQVRIQRVDREPMFESFSQIIRSYILWGKSDGSLDALDQVRIWKFKDQNPKVEDLKLLSRTTTRNWNW